MFRRSLSVLSGDCLRAGEEFGSFAKDSDASCDTSLRGVDFRLFGFGIACSDDNFLFSWPPIQKKCGEGMFKNKPDAILEVKKPILQKCARKSSC